MKLSALATEHYAARAAGGLVLSDAEVLDSLISAARFYAGYGDIRSLSLSDPLPGAPGPVPTEPAPEVPESLPIKSLALITGDTEVTTGEWAIIRPLFMLYAERENAMRLEATRGLGLDVFGRSVAEITADITMMETETLPTKSFSYAVIEVA